MPAKKIAKKAKSKSNKQRTDKELKGVTLLGSEKTEYSQNYAPEVLESFPNKNPKFDAWTTFVCTEFTSLCPKTGQPDFAKVFINYVADKTMVESKSLKLYLFSFRNHGDFHEDCIQKICNDLYDLMKPKYIEVIGEFTPRGGIAIFPFSSRSNSQAKYKRIKEERFLSYSPGKYSTDLSKVY
ncbi:MAG: 7-cyano-7-deazaguanine reductase [Halobacteriovoraceae bacterium]|nr:7-cyano-7-deazaguanine reductase [Halobacteriovoraceae bacterium]|tara:strand:- start:36146 stop:36694 length:549 start_codon:yes stop_codon:yes gene_type:complete